MKTIKFKVEGTTPLMMNNPQTVNPFNSYTVALKELTAKRKKTEDDMENIFRLKFLASLYVDNDGHYIIPADHFHRSVISAAKEQKMGTKFMQSLFIYQDCLLDFPEKAMTPEQLWAEKSHVDVRDCVVQRARITACRAIFNKWSATVECWYDETQIDEADIVRFFNIAGIRHGIGTYRAKFGKFKAEKI